MGKWCIAQQGFFKPSELPLPSFTALGGYGYDVQHTFVGFNGQVDGKGGFIAKPDDLPGGCIANKRSHYFDGADWDVGEPITTG